MIKRGKIFRKRVVLSKTAGFIILGLLLLIDTIFDVLRGTQGNPLFNPIENTFGINAFPLLVPFALVFFYGVIKIVAWIVLKIEKVPNMEEILLTTLVIIFFVHDMWVFSVDYLNFSLIRDYHKMIPIYIIIGLAYSTWAERSLKRKK